MIHEEFNPNHCSSCINKQCDVCMDAYKTKGGLKKNGNGWTLFSFDPDGYMLMRYAQRKALDFLTDKIRRRVG